MLLKLDTSREVRARVVRFFQWALKDLKQAMLGRALPSGAGAASVGAPALLPPKYLPAYRAFLCHVKDMPTPLLVQAAAAFGITLDADAIAAERAALAGSGAGRVKAQAAATDGDLVARFLGDLATGVVVGADREVRKEELYQRFLVWCASARGVAASRTYFNRGIVRHAKAREVRRGHNADRCWRGVGLLPTIALREGGRR